ncbi:hypothetical protein D9619_006690 [Psilocybe cf. subviscida]|uniref:Uncharacterized protein n=1 Tax=Psilocybe cf. subviscida TaxID=2480587 RepID=A0A8H5B663_9AGAR|nr:hypothetical protein D9619_006690 [Psilocybe cf. subviscida]
MQSISGSRFKKLSPAAPLSQFLSKHDASHNSGFITRLDRSPVRSKIITFTKSLALNIGITLFMLAVCALSLFRCHHSNFPPNMVMSLWLTQNALVLSAVAILARSSVVPFFLGECRLRVCYGFRATEIIIQRPAASAMMLPQSQSQGEKEKGYASHNYDAEYQYWRMALHAIHPSRCYAAASALLSPEYWMQEYEVVFDALRSIAAGEFEEDGLEFAIWKQDAKRVWNVCELWRMHEIMSDQQEISFFEAFLTESGKPELLAVWQKMLAPSTMPEKASLREVSSKTYHEVVGKFAQQGLDYETVWSQISEETWRSKSCS